MKKDLDFYLNALTNLRRDNKNGGAPHKPILILALLKSIESLSVQSNKIYITPDLVAEFRLLWNVYVSSNHSPRFTLPFYHLKNEKSDFWRLTPNPGCEIWIESKNSMRNFQSLKTAVSYAEIDQILFDILLDKVNREIVRQAVITKYFPNSDESLEYNSKNSKTNDDILNDSVVEYSRKIKELQRKLSKSDFAEEMFYRSAEFKRTLSRVYDNTCAISRLKVVPEQNISLLDGCHIVPFSKSFDNTIPNGIILTPTLHRAFDCGLIGIDDNYTVVSGNNFIEQGKSFYSIEQFIGQPILPPKQTKYYPSFENLKFHRNHFRFK